MNQYNIAEAKAHPSELLQKAMPGEDVVIARDSQPLVRLVPVEPLPSTRVDGSVKGTLIAIAPGLDAPLADFQDYS
jgi:prevent-host-death family protein